jgi:hypothetical protein
MREGVCGEVVVFVVEAVVVCVKAVIGVVSCCGGFPGIGSAQQVSVVW